MAHRSRYVELDLLRSFAVLLMIVYHLAYDLQEFSGWQIGIFENTGWILLRQGTAALFLLLVGISFSISWSRGRSRTTPTMLFCKYLQRGLGVFACGMLVSAATYWFEPETYVRFGVLHLIGVSILLLPFFARMREWNGLVGLLILSFGTIMPLTAGRPFDAAQGWRPALVPLGIMPADFMSVDYFPLIPWFGLVLIGYAIGFRVYVKRPPPLFFILHSSFFILGWPGRHALVIYLLHQPIILGILGALGALGTVGALQ